MKTWTWHQKHLVHEPSRSPVVVIVSWSSLWPLFFLVQLAKGRAAQRTLIKSMKKSCVRCRVSTLQVVKQQPPVYCCQAVSLDMTRAGAPLAECWLIFLLFSFHSFIHFLYPLSPELRVSGGQLGHLPAVIGWNQGDSLDKIIITVVVVVVHSKVYKNCKGIVDTCFIFFKLFENVLVTQSGREDCVMQWILVVRLKTATSKTSPNPFLLLEKIWEIWPRFFEDKITRVSATLNRRTIGEIFSTTEKKKKLKAILLRPWGVKFKIVGSLWTR